VLECRETLPNWLTLIVCTRPSLRPRSASILCSPTPALAIRSLWGVTEEHFDRLFNINVRGTLFTCRRPYAIE